jgi:hypothetical protein
MPLPALQLAAVVSATAAPNIFGGCAYTAHPNTTYLGHNVIACKDAEGLASCQSRCTSDTHCAGFGLYTSGSHKGRCCTKRDNDGAHTWIAGCSYTKEVTGSCPFTPSPSPHPPPPHLPPAPPSAPVDVGVIFVGNESYPYNKGAMIQPLPGGRLAAACQAGAHEASGDQRILTAISADGGRPGTWSDWTAAAPQPAGLDWAQWEPTLFLTPDNRTLFLFYSEGPKSPGPYLLFAATAPVDASSGAVGVWSAPRVIMNVSNHPPYKYMYPISRVVISPRDGAWLLPCDWGCGDAQTGAFTVRSTSQGKTWTVDDPIPGLPTHGMCPEPAMAAVNSSTILAVVRSKEAGFTQSWSHDGGHHWDTATRSPVDGAASKPALAAFRTDDRTLKVVLAYNVVTRERMALSTTVDGGRTWRYFATLDNGTSRMVPGETSDAYPTVVAVGAELLTTWSTYGSGGGSGGGGFNTIKLARTALP